MIGNISKSKGFKGDKGDPFTYEDLTDEQKAELLGGANFADKEELELHKYNANNPHRVTKEQIGLGNVDNTSDKDKPISDAVAKELKNKVDKLEKPKDSNVVYVETKSGNTIGIGYATNPKSFTIPQRLNLGELLVRDNPSLDNEAVSKGYVDKLVSENSNDINLDFNEIQNMPIKIKNLGTWKYVYDVSLDEEFEYIESDYSTFEEALDNATETGIYRLKNSYADIFEGEDEETVVISDDCLLFVFEGVETYNVQKVVHQLLLSSVDFYGGFSKWSLPKVRTYCFNDEDGEMAWTVWSNEPDDYRFINYGFENALFKVDNIDEDYRLYDGSAYYPTVSAVINYVQKILTGFKPEVEIPMPAESIRANILHEPTLIYEDDPLIDFLTLSEDNSSGDGWYSWQVPYLIPTNEFKITNDLLDNSHAFSVYSASVIGKMYTSLTSRIANLESKITELESKIS